MPAIARFLTVPVILLACASTQAGVVINEIFYRAPDDIQGLQWLELYNPEAKAIDLSGWKLTDGIRFDFPANTSIAANGFIVICQDTKRFREYYNVPVAGEFTKQL